MGEEGSARRRPIELECEMIDWEAGFSGILAGVNEPVMSGNSLMKPSNVDMTKSTEGSRVKIHDSAMICK